MSSKCAARDIQLLCCQIQQCLIQQLNESQEQSNFCSTVRLGPVLVHASNSDTRGRNGSATISCYNYLLFGDLMWSMYFKLHLDQQIADSFEENIPE